MRSKQEQRRKRIYESYFIKRFRCINFTVDHFQARKIPKRSIYYIIKCAENDSRNEKVKESGRKAIQMKKKNIQRLKDMFYHHDWISQWQEARKYGFSQEVINYKLKTNRTIICHKKKKKLTRMKAQPERIRTWCYPLFENSKIIR